MILHRFRHAVCALAFMSCAATSYSQTSSVDSSESADFNEVGKQVAIALQNSNFARLPFNAQLGERFLTQYLRTLDPNRVFFTKADVELFRKNYGPNAQEPESELQNLILRGRTVEVSASIYQIYLQRVEDRIKDAFAHLKDVKTDFSAKTTIVRNRKEAEWPKDEADAKQIFRQQIEDALLSETLRQEVLTKMANEQSKQDVLKGEIAPREKLRLRYERVLHAVKDVTKDEIAIQLLGAIARAYDPHTDYMGYSEMKKFRDEMSNQLVGIGALLQADPDGSTKVMGIVTGGPADREGTLKLNDRVVAVDTNNTGEMVDIMFMQVDKVVDLIRGGLGTTVRLKVEPAAGAAGEAKFVMVKREKIEKKDEQASAHVLDVKQKDGTTRRVGFLTLPSFYSDFRGTVSSADDVAILLKRLNKEHIDGLVFDLRGNGGGSLEDVRRMVGFFVKRSAAVQVKGEVGQIESQMTDMGKPIYTGPMVVLIDKTSASASEIFAGALQDNNMAVIAGGEASFGKGTVQMQLDVSRLLPYMVNRDKAGALKITFQKFYRPSGSSTQNEGVRSDIVLPSLFDAMKIGESSLDYALPHDRINPASSLKPLAKEELHLAKLKEESTTRVKGNKDLTYIAEDMAKLTKREAENQISLNIEDRRKEIAETEQTQKARNIERKERFAQMLIDDRKNLVFYKLTLDNAQKDEPLPVIDPAKENEAFMRRAKDATESLDDTPEWPSMLDPVKRESLNILQDLIQLKKPAEAAEEPKKVASA